MLKGRGPSLTLCQSLTQVWRWEDSATPLFFDPPPVVNHFLGDFDDSSQSTAKNKVGHKHYVSGVRLMKDKRNQAE